MSGSDENTIDVWNDTGRDARRQSFLRNLQHKQKRERKAKSVKSKATHENQRKGDADDKENKHAKTGKSKSERGERRKSKQAQKSNATPRGANRASRAPDLAYWLHHESVESLKMSVQCIDDIRSLEIADERRRIQLERAQEAFWRRLFGWAIDEGADWHQTLQTERDQRRLDWLRRRTHKPKHIPAAVAVGNKASSKLRRRELKQLILDDMREAHLAEAEDDRRFSGDYAQTAKALRRANMGSLPDQLLASIFRFLAVRDHVAVGSASKQLFRVSQFPHSWFGMSLGPLHCARISLHKPKVRVGILAAARPEHLSLQWTAMPIFLPGTDHLRTLKLSLARNTWSERDRLCESMTQLFKTRQFPLLHTLTVDFPHFDLRALDPLALPNLTSVSVTITAGDMHIDFGCLDVLSKLKLRSLLLSGWFPSQILHYLWHLPLTSLELHQTAPWEEKQESGRDGFEFGAGKRLVLSQLRSLTLSEHAGKLLHTIMAPDLTSLGIDVGCLSVFRANASRFSLLRTLTVARSNMSTGVEAASNEEDCLWAQFIGSLSALQHLRSLSCHLGNTPSHIVRMFQDAPLQTLLRLCAPSSTLLQPSLGLADAAKLLKSAVADLNTEHFPTLPTRKRCIGRTQNVPLLDLDLDMDVDSRGLKRQE